MAEATNLDSPLLNATLAAIIYIYPRSTAYIYLDHPEDWRLEEEPWRALLALLPESIPGWRQASQAEELPGTAGSCRGRWSGHDTRRA